MVLVPTAALLGSFLAVKDKDTVPAAVRGALLQASAVGLTAAVCSHPSVNHTALFAKDASDGSFPLWSHLLFYPYLYSLRAYVLLRRLKNREPVFTQVADGLYVGGWPCRAADLPPPAPDGGARPPAVVDCTCELPRPACLAGLPYLNVPTWDSRGLRLRDMDRAVEWARERRRQGHAVLVHCAFGHGRSVAVVCALLVALGMAHSWQDGERMVKRVRPRVHLNKGQVAVLQQWSSSRRGGSGSGGSSAAAGHAGAGGGEGALV